MNPNRTRILGQWLAQWLVALSYELDAPHTHHTPPLKKKSWGVGQFKDSSCKVS